jgi:uncharacterized membrane protein YbhN (UPF0104 family)
MSETLEPAAPALDAPEPLRRRTRRLVRLGALAAAAACAVFALRRADLREVGRSLAGARLELLALGALANLASLAAHAARWRAVVPPVRARVRWRDAVAALVAGFAVGMVLPARGGDLYRAHHLARRSGHSMSSMVVASMLDYVVGTVAFVVLLGVLVAAAPLPTWAVRGLAITAALAAVAVAAAWWLKPRRGAAHADGVAGFVERLRFGLALVHSPRALLASLAWAFAGWAAEVAIALATLAALGLQASFTTAALAVVAASAAAAVPLAPGNAGSFELATALGVAGTGVGADHALAFAVAFHLVHLVPVAVLGGAVLIRDAVARGP